MSIIIKYLKKNVSVEERKILMIWDWYDSIIVEYWKNKNLLGNIPNQPSKFRTKNWVEINDGSRGT